MSLALRFSMTESLTASLARIERARRFLDSSRVSRDWRASRRARALLLEAHHATRLEGTRLTLEGAEQILSGHAVPEADAGDARALLNFRDALTFVGEHVNGGGPLGEGLIREIHRRLTDGVDGGAAPPGEYRRADGYVVRAANRQVVYRPPPPAEVPALMGALVGSLSDAGDVHPVVAAGGVEVQLTHIHPFVSGNGRTARLLSMLSLCRAGYDVTGLLAISEYYDRNRAACSLARQRVRDAGMDLTAWLEFFTLALATELEAVRSEGEREIRRDVVARHGLTERQAVAVGHVVAEGRLTIADFERLCPGAPRRALQRELKKLVDKGLVRRAGTPNRPQYLAGDELPGAD